MAEFARLGDLKPLPQGVLDVLEAEYNEGVIADSTVDDELVGIFIKMSVKGLIWYNPAAFEAAGYEVPEDWDGLNSEPAGCLLHHQASFITSFFEENSPGVAEAGTTYDFFPMPAIDFDGVVYGGDLFGMFNDTPQAQALMEYLVTA